MANPHWRCTVRAILLLGVLAPLAGGCGGSGSQSPKEGRKKWEPPVGKAGEVAKKKSVAELIALWRNFPEDPSQFAQHAVYAEALGKHGAAAKEAVADLEPYATSEEPYFRKGALKGLAGIGKDALPALRKAMEFSNAQGEHAVEVRWDAAAAIAKLGPDAEPAIPDLLKRIQDAGENPNVKLAAAEALGAIGEPALPALQEARKVYRKNHAVGEAPVLRTLNEALQKLKAAE